MEKDRGGRVMAMVALFVGVIGLTIGFAAYTSYLKIDTTAHVQTSDNGNWNVGFSTDGTNIATNGTVNGINTTSATPALSGGSVTVTKYTIAQNANAVLKPVSGSSVHYDLNILNKGTLTAYLDSVSFSNTPVRCSYLTSSDVTDTWIEGSAGQGTQQTVTEGETISNADCAAMFGLTLQIGSDNYTATSSSITGKTLAANASTPAVLTLAYKGDNAADTAAARLTGDIKVEAGSITVVYTSTAAGH